MFQLQFLHHSKLSLSLPALLLIAATRIKGETIDAQFLNVSASSSQYYDYFYSCNSCGRGIQWEVDRESAATHTVTDNIGSVAYETQHNDSSVLRFTSILVGKQQQDDYTCMDALLIVTRTELRPIQVICRGTSQQIIIDYQLPDNIDKNIENGDVKLDFVISHQEGVIARNSNFVTHVFLCTTSETSQLWERDNKLAGAFNSVDNAGSSYFEVHSLESSVISRAAVLLVKHPHVELSSVLVISELNSTENLTVSCLSDSSFATINVASSATTSIPDIHNSTSSNLPMANSDSTDSLSSNHQTVSHADSLCCSKYRLLSFFLLLQVPSWLQQYWRSH